jgi:hypothetical protein
MVLHPPPYGVSNFVSGPLWELVGGGWIRSHVFPYVVSMSDLRFSVPFICFEYRKGYMVSPPPPVGFWNLVSGPIVGVGGGEAGFWPMFSLMLLLHQN